MNHHSSKIGLLALGLVTILAGCTAPANDVDDAAKLETARIGQTTQADSTSSTYLGPCIERAGDTFTRNGNERCTVVSSSTGTTSYPNGSGSVTYVTCTQTLQCEPLISDLPAGQGALTGDEYVPAVFP